MNTYYHSFEVRCPNGEDSVRYYLRIRSMEMIMVESIIKACKFSEPMYHEDIAHSLCLRLPGRHRITANHHGVEVVTKR